MRTEAVKAGYSETMFEGKQPNIPLVDSASFKKAARGSESGEQDKLPF